MTGSAAHSEILVARTDGVVRLTLNRPGRGNSLTTSLLDSLSQTLHAEAATARAVVLTGTAPCFSTGGDVTAIREHASSAESLQAYSDALVGGLNRVLLQLRALPCPVIAAVNGPVTGGSLGLMLRTAFIQPYYAQMGFAPDGGWTALLPDRIGRARTARWLALDQRVSADDALEMGLTDQLAEPADFDQALADMLARLVSHDASVIATSRRLVDAQAGAGGLAGRLDAERQAFLVQIARPETRIRMDRFLAASRTPAEMEAHA